MALGALAAVALAAPAEAQQGIVQQGYAVVTGFSGYVAAPPPPGASDPFDYVTINPDGPAANVVDLTTLGPQGALSGVTKPFTLSATQVGQVFGVALDTAPQPNIYLAATSAYGLSIYATDANGLQQRLHTGAAGAQFVPGQFGPPEQGGGPGSIWRVDGVTGEVQLFANIDGGTNSVAGLGGLAFDPASQQLFAAERGTGVIYRLGLDGTVRGTYDHGAEGRPGAGLPPIAMGASSPVDIQSPSFDTGNPQTWGVTSPARRVFALAVHNQRLYYSVAQGPQVWSAPIGPGGAVSGSGARVEIEVPSLTDGVEIASITFDGQGRMYLAERGATTGDYDLSQLAVGGQSRVLRYAPKAPGDPSPGLWAPAPDQYSVGLPPSYNNANGGVALNYGYRPDGRMNPGACGATVWSSGERLLDPGDGSTGFPTVDGLQGNGTNLFQPQNTPPTQSWFVDYDDQAGDPSFLGYMGAIATIPCAGQASPPQTVDCPRGTYLSNGECFLFPNCPHGTTFQDGQCVYPQCPSNFIVLQGQCVPPPVSCPSGSVYLNGHCAPIGCPPGLQQQPNGYCSCPQGTFYLNGHCVPANSCPPGTIKLGGLCICPPGLFLQNGHCSPLQCPPGQSPTLLGQCVPILCPPGEQLKNGACVPIVCPPGQQLFDGHCVPACPKFTFRQPDGSCKPIILCLPPKQNVNGQCLAPCPKFTVRQPNGSCKPIFLPPVGVCLAPKQMVNGQCVDPCPKFTTRQPDGSCKPILTLCVAPKQMVNGQCVDPCPKFTTRQPDGSCKPIILPPIKLCIAPKEMVNGQCVDACPKFTARQPDGSCKPILTLCITPKEMVNGQCVNPCPKFTTRQPDGSCKPILVKPILNPGLIQQLQPVCAAPKEIVNGSCVDPCPKFTTRQPDGSCKPILVKPIVNPGLIQQLQPVCAAPKEIVNGSCVDPCPKFTTRQPDGSCKPILLKPLTVNPGIIKLQDACTAPKEMVNGSCVDACPAGQIRLKNGTCVVPNINPGVLKQIPQP